MFIVVFLIMLPIYLQTNDPILAWQAGLAWAFIIGVIVLLGAFVGPTIRKYTPRAAMLGTLAGISIAFISMRPELPDVGGALDRVRRARDHPDQLDGERASAVRRAGRPGSGDRRHDPRLDRRAARLERLHGADGGGRIARRVRSAAAGLLGRRDHGPRRHLAAPGDRHTARRVQLHRGDEQRRERGRRRRQLQSAPHSPGRRARRRGRLRARQPVPASSVHRSPRLEGGGRPHRLFARDRDRDRAGVLPRPDRAPARDHSAGRDPADPLVHRPGDRRPGVPGVARPACAGGGPGDHPEHRRLGPDPGRRGARRGRHLGRSVGLRRLDGHGRGLPRHGAGRRRRRARGPGPRRGRRLHHRSPVPLGRGAMRSPARSSRSSASSTAPSWKWRHRRWWRWATP